MGLEHSWPPRVTRGLHSDNRSHRRLCLSLGMLALGALAAFGCRDLLSDLGRIEIEVRTVVSGDQPTGTWQVNVQEMVDDPTTPGAGLIPGSILMTKRVGPNGTASFGSGDGLIEGRWDVRILNTGQLGAFTCVPPDSNFGLVEIDTQDRPGKYGERFEFRTTCSGVLMADAGPDQVVDVGAFVILDGTGSTGSSPSYMWSLVSAPLLSNATISSPTTPTATFDLDEPGVYEVELTVTSGSASDMDTVLISTNAPTITGIGPTSGPPGTQVTIFATNISPDPSGTGNQVAFNGVPANFTMTTPTEILATVPGTATTGPVTVTVVSTGAVATGPVFTVTAPVDPWTFVLPQGLGDDYRSVSFANSSTGMTAGTNRNVLRSTDGGVTWSAVTSISSGNPVSISVPDPQVAYVVSLIGGGTSHVFKTSDGGMNWTTVRAQAGEGHQAVAFAGATEGWVVGAGGSILHTNDGGTSWNPQNSSTSETLRSVFFVNNQLGVALGDNATVARTADGGATSWTAATVSGAALLTDVWLVDASNGMLVGRDANGAPLIWTTIDGGATWNPVSHQGLPGNLQVGAVSLGSTTVATLWGDNPTLGVGEFYRSTDGGVTWALEQGTNPYDLRDIVMFGATLGVATGDGAIFHRQ